MKNENNNYRCMKCEGKNIKDHGLYCPKKQSNIDITNKKIEQQTKELYNER